MEILSISYQDLAILASLVFLMGLLLSLNGFSKTKAFWWASVRMTVQLLFMGVWLTWVFIADSWIWVALVAWIMLVFAGYEIGQRQTYRFQRFGSYIIGLIALSMTALVLTVFALTVIIQPQPWYSPQYAIPILGMVLGNSMTAIGLALDVLTRLSQKMQAQIEAQLALGKNTKEAMAFIREEAMHSAMIPVINMLVAAGIISLPGMMTGQILAGVSPMEAVKYQIMVMFLIALSTSAGVLLAIRIAETKLFDSRQRLAKKVLIRD